MSPRKKAKPQLKIVFDTNVLFTKTASALLTDNVKSFIDENTRHSDLSIKWYLSDIVVGERRFQMQKEAYIFLPQIKKLERLLDHNLNITQDILTDRVNKTINKQMSSLGISELSLDTNSIDWKKLITRAIDRLPPFDAKKNEKGFRDSLIAESFFQLVSKSPSTPKVCRIIFVTEDDKLTEFLKECTSKNRNVRILNNLSELESLINTLVSQVTEEFIVEIKDTISNYFFSKNDRTGLYYTEKIKNQIEGIYSEELESVPTLDLYRDNGTWWISNPVFIKKVRQRMHWMTPIQVDAKLYKYESETPLSDLLAENPLSKSVRVGQGVSFGSDLLAQSPVLRSIYAGQELQSGIGSFLTETRTKIDTGKGHTNFEVSWSVNITPTKKFRNPKIDDMQFISTKWDE